jgi:hypothetical protein
MKQKINPAAAIVCLVVVVGVVVFFGVRMVFGPPPTPAASKNEAPPQEKIVNGVKVPANVPSDYMERYGNRQGQSVGTGQPSPP